METANTIAAINETTGLAPAAGGVVMLETALIDPNPVSYTHLTLPTIA